MDVYLESINRFAAIQGAETNRISVLDFYDRMIKNAAMHVDVSVVDNRHGFNPDHAAGCGNARD